MKALSFNSSFVNNSIFVIDALPDGDLSTAHHLFDNLIDYKANRDDGPHLEYRKINSYSDFVLILAELEWLCASGIRPIIHIEGHGDRATGLALGSSNDHIDWEDLVERLRRINIASKNNTGVVIAACHGMYALMAIKITELTPFHFLLGSQDEVTAGQIIDQMERFYKNLIDNVSVTEAYASIDKKFDLFIAERHFAMAIGRYFKRVCMGKGRRERVERLTTEAKAAFNNQGIVVNRQMLKKIRKEAKFTVKPSKRVFDRFARSFLHGNCSVSYNDFISFIADK